MALNNVTTAISDGGSGGGNFDLNIDAEKFYYGYKIVENNFQAFDNLSNAVLSITAKVNSLGVNFSNISSKIKNDNSELNDMYNRMISFKKTLERIDPSNALLFSNLDVIMYATFGGDITETDLALYGENCKQIYENAINKDPKDLTNLEKFILNSYVSLPESFNNGLKLQEYIKLEKQYAQVSKAYQEIQSKIYNITRNYRGPMPDEQVAKVKTLVAKRDEYLNNMSSIRNRKDELRTELIDAGLIEKNSKESFTEAGKQLWSSFTDIFKTGGDLGGILVETDEFLNELISTGTVLSGNVLAAGFNIIEDASSGLEIVLATGSTPFTLGYDGIKYLYSSLAGTEFSSYTKAFWNQVGLDIDYDVTGSMTESWYNDFLLGKIINDNSTIKYDSATAKSVTNTVKTPLKIAAAALLGYLTGGSTIALVSSGFLQGSGETAKESLNSGSMNASKVVNSYLGGAEGAANWFFYGRTADNIINALKNKIIPSPYLDNPNKRNIIEATDDVLNKLINTNPETIKNVLSSTLSKPNIYISTLGHLCGEIKTELDNGEIEYDKLGIEIVKRISISVFGEYFRYLKVPDVNIEETDEIETDVKYPYTIEEIEVPDVIDITD
mgnify:FL=1